VLFLISTAVLSATSHLFLAGLISAFVAGSGGMALGKLAKRKTEFYDQRSKESKAVLAENYWLQQRQNEIKNQRNLAIRNHIRTNCDSIKNMTNAWAIGTTGEPVTAALSKERRKDLMAEYKGLARSTGILLPKDGVPTRKLYRALQSLYRDNHGAFNND
jgi:hypothetical protein